MDEQTFSQGAPAPTPSPDTLRDTAPRDDGAPDAPDHSRSSAEAFGEGGSSAIDSGEDAATDAYGRDPDRWAGSGDPDDPTAGLSDREYDIYWAGVRDSLRLERHPRPGEATPAPAPRERDIIASPPADPDDALVRPWLDDLESGLRAEAYRDGGWNPRRQRVFLEALADGGIVTRACRAASISPRAAYNLRNRDAIFAEARVAAQALARRRLADDLLERALRGQVDRIVRNGEVVAERHRTDNRLALGLLTRLDRQAEPDTAWQIRNPDQGPTPHKVLMAHWDQYLDTLAPLSPPHENGGAEGVAQQQSRRLRPRAQARRARG